MSSISPSGRTPHTTWEQYIDASPDLKAIRQGKVSEVAAREIESLAKENVADTNKETLLEYAARNDNTKLLLLVLKANKSLSKEQLKKALDLAKENKEQSSAELFLSIIYEDKDPKEVFKEFIINEYSLRAEGHPSDEEEDFDEGVPFDEFNFPAQPLDEPASFIYHPDPQKDATTVENIKGFKSLFHVDVTLEDKGIVSLDFPISTLTLAIRFFPDKIAEIVKLGANPNFKYLGSKQNAIFYALQYNLDAIKPLIQAGANVNAKNQDGNTPLMQAIQYKPEAVRMLLDLGADIHLRNNQDQTATDIAKKYNPRLLPLTRSNNFEIRRPGRGDLSE